MKKVLLCASAALAMAMSSCTITLPINATSNPVGAKVGTATADIFFSVFCFGGDASIKTAAKNGGISRISTVDMKQMTILNVYTQLTTIVSGE